MPIFAESKRVSSGSRASARSFDLDQAGTIASLTCAVHCAIMPLAITLLPLLGLTFLADERLEWGLLGLSGLIGVSSLCLGFREHRRRIALAVLAVGLSLLTLGRISEEHQWGHGAVLVVVLGGMTIAASHLMNRHLCRTCRRCSAAHEAEKAES